MEPDKVELKKNEEPTIFEAHCTHCKEKTILTLDDGRKVYLPYNLVQIPEDETLKKEFEELLKDNEGKYKNNRSIKRRIIHGCPVCGKDIDICCQDYLDFYTKKEEKSETNE